MLELYNIGLSEDAIKNMLEVNPMINDLTNKEIIEKINILKSINLSDIDIINILENNSLFLLKSSNDLNQLFNKLNQLGFNNIDLLLDANPYILNIDSYEIDNYINNRLNNNDSLEDIIEDLETNPYLFNEL